MVTKDCRPWPRRSPSGASAPRRRRGGRPPRAASAACSRPSAGRREIFCIWSWYLPTRSIRAQKTTLSTKESKSMLKAPRRWEPVFIDRMPSITSEVELLGDRAPVVLGEQVEHLVAVAQLLRHHAEDPELLLLLLGAGEREAVLLDRAELGGGLGADGAEEVVRLLGLAARRRAWPSASPSCRRTRSRCTSPSRGRRRARNAGRWGSACPSSRSGSRSPAGRRRATRRTAS